MDILKAYFSLIDPRLLNRVTGVEGEFIKQFQEQKFLSEEAFIREFCKKKHDRNYYGSIKSRTIKTLQILVIMSPPLGVNLVKKKYDSCQKKFLLGQKFLTKGERTEGIRLIKQAWKIAIDYDFVHLASELSSILYHHHLYYEHNAAKEEFYCNQADRYLTDYLAEKKAEHYLYQILKSTSKSIQPQVIQNTIEKVEKYKGTSLRYQVYKAILYVHLGFHSADYQSVVSICKQTLQFFNDKKGVYITHYHSFLKSQGIAQMAMAQYAEAQKSFQASEKYALNKSFNDYLVRYYKTLNAIRAGQYQIAYELYQQNKRCKIPALREQFAIIEAYLCFLHHFKDLQLVKKFRLGKYLNETFKAQTDKRGDNINILIAELLVYFVRDRDKFIDRVDAIRNYSYRYLQGKETLRAKSFIKILCLMPSVDFHPTALQRRAKKSIAYLEKNPVSMGSNFAIEIIPFDRLLKMLLQELQQKVA